jgi:hypothetical protein
MAQDRKKKTDGKSAKLAFRERSGVQDSPQRHFSTRPEDIVKIFPDGRLLARTPEGTYYFTTSFYAQSDLADPNRYGRPSSIVPPEEVAALLSESSSLRS